MKLREFVTLLDDNWTFLADYLEPGANEYTLHECTRDQDFEVLIKEFGDTELYSFYSDIQGKYVFVDLVFTGKDGKLVNLSTGSVNGSSPLGAKYISLEKLPDEVLSMITVKSL